MPIKNLMKRKESRILEFKSKVSDNIGEMMWHDYGTIFLYYQMEGAEKNHIKNLLIWGG